MKVVSDFFRKWVKSNGGGSWLFVFASFGVTQSTFGVCTWRGEVAKGWTHLSSLHSTSKQLDANCLNFDSMLPLYRGRKFNKIFERCKWIFKMSGGEIPLARKPLLQKCQQKTHFIKASLLHLTSPVSTVLLFINTRIQKDARNLENRGLHQSFFSIHVLVCIAAL